MTDDPPWMAIARREIGVKELMGTAHAPRILQYHAATRMQAKSDETPWCSAFVCWVLEQCGVSSTRSAAAISYEKFGFPVTPRPGAIVVLSRPTADNPRSRHVAFLNRIVDDRFWELLGGNQRNRVCVLPYRADTATAVRWPFELIA